jgi:alkylhydroperoxidase/carboxymuconolactone decarboxylase family protein YurZ
MNQTADRAVLLHHLQQFNPTNNTVARVLSLFSASCTFADKEILEESLKLGKRYDISRDIFYEAVLQSYLFIGFPRMLNAAFVLDNIFPNEKNGSECKDLSEENFIEWNKRGEELYKKVYKDKSELLKDRVVSIAPEIYKWMIIEGYGKVLSRNILDIKTRELSIIALLMMENRTAQRYRQGIG